MATRVAGGGFSFSIASVGGTWSWTVAADNVLNAGQFVQVRDVVTPYGPLSVANVPLPGDVVAAMAASLTDFQSQLAPSIYLTSASSFSATVTEAGAAQDVAAVAFLNAGAFGSYMSVTAAPDAPWLSSTPSVVSGLGKNEAGQVEARVSPASMLASSSPYVGHLNLQDNASHVVPVTFNVTVLPRPTVGLSPASVSLTYSLTGGSPAPLAIMVTNSGPPGSILNFALAKVQNQSSWLGVAPTSGGPLGSGGFVNVLFSVVLGHAPSIVGTYVETVRLTAPSATIPSIDIPVSLYVVA